MPTTVRHVCVCGVPEGVCDCGMSAIVRLHGVFWGCLQSCTVGSIHTHVMHIACHQVFDTHGTPRKKCQREVLMPNDIKGMVLSIIHV